MLILIYTNLAVTIEMKYVRKQNELAIWMGNDQSCWISITLNVALFKVKIQQWNIVVRRSGDCCRNSFRYTGTLIPETMLRYDQFETTCRRHYVPVLHTQTCTRTVPNRIKHVLSHTERARGSGCWRLRFNIK